MAKIKTNYAEITVGGDPTKPCFRIRYFDPADRDYHYGFGSYDIKNVFKWLREEFEIVDENENAKRDIERRKFDLTMDFARVLSDIYNATIDLNKVKTYEDLAKWYETHDVEKVLRHVWR